MLSSSFSAKITKFLLFQISFFVFEIIILSFYNEKFVIFAAVK